MYKVDRWSNYTITRFKVHVIGFPLAYVLNYTLFHSATFSRNRLSFDLRQHTDNQFSIFALHLQYYIGVTTKDLEDKGVGMHPVAV